MKTAIVTRNAGLDAETALANSGILRIYTGSQPATPETAASGTLLAELTLNSTAFGVAALGVATANAITDDSTANATGTAGWFRVFRSNGTTPVYDGSVGTSGADLNINSVAIQANAAVGISSLTWTLPE